MLRLLAAMALAVLAAPAMAATPAKVARLTCAGMAERLGLHVPGLALPKRLPPEAVGAWQRAYDAMAPMSDAEVGILWNLDCAGSLARADWPEAWSSDDALFRVEGETLRVLGTIGPRFAGDLAAALAAAPKVTRVALASRGGVMGAAMEAGDLIAARDLDTGLAGHCVSACVLVYLGGRNRDLPDGPDLLGFHQASWPGGEPVWFANPFQLGLLLWLAGTGVEAGTVMGWMQSAPPEGMHLPDRAALCAAGIAPLPDCGPKAPDAR